MAARTETQTTIRGIGGGGLAGDIHVIAGGDSDCVRVAFEADAQGWSVFDAGRGFHRRDGSATFFLLPKEAAELGEAVRLLSEEQG